MLFLKYQIKDLIIKITSIVVVIMQRSLLRGILLIHSVYSQSQKTGCYEILIARERRCEK
jgi:hypothetical protein